MIPPSPILQQASGQTWGLLGLLSWCHNRQSMEMLEKEDSNQAGAADAIQRNWAQLGSKEGFLPVASQNASSERYLQYSKACLFIIERQATNMWSRQIAVLREQNGFNSQCHEMLVWFFWTGRSGLIIAAAERAIESVLLFPVPLSRNSYISIFYKWKICKGTDRRSVIHRHKIWCTGIKIWVWETDGKKHQRELIWIHSKLVHYHHNFF